MIKFIINSMTEAIWFLIQDLKRLNDIFDDMITNNSIVKIILKGGGANYCMKIQVLSLLLIVSLPVFMEGLEINHFQKHTNGRFLHDIMWIIVGCVDSYGEDCRYPCSKHCINGACDRFNGSCVFGCVNGFIGDKCNKGTCICYLSFDKKKWQQLIDMYCC